MKFLCAGPGACFLYVAEHILPKCKPLDVGWFSHENPFEMDISNFRYAPDAMRFFGGTPSPAPIILANSALRVWAEAGMETTHTRIQEHLTYLHKHLPDGAAISPTDPFKRGATLVVANAHGERVKDALLAEGIKFDQRQQGYRFSVHGYTSEVEVERLAGVLGGT